MPTAADGRVTFYVDLLHSGKKFQGSFTVRRPNFGDVGAIAAGISRLAQGQPIVDQQTGAILNAIANLSVLTEEHPEWWMDVIESENIPLVMAVYAHYLREREESPFRQAESSGDTTNTTGGAARSARAGRNPSGADGGGTSESGE